MIDGACFAVMALVMCVGMSSFIQNRHMDNPPPFYSVLMQWNEKQERPQQSDASQDEKRQPAALPPRPALKQETRSWFFLSVFLLVLSIPTMSIADGFLRVCQTPPGSITTALWQRLPLSSSSLIYYFVAGFIVHLHIWTVELFYRVGATTVLWLLVLINHPTTNGLMGSVYRVTKRFLEQPPIFDRPWLAHSPYELWSKRWHQMFRGGFMKLAYQPVRSLFRSKKYAALGRFLAAMAVFLASGLMHEYVLVSMVGPSRLAYQQFYKSILGQQVLFFLLQGLSTILTFPGSSLATRFGSKIPGWLATPLTVLWVVVTAPLFVDPYLRIGLHLEASIPFYPTTFDPYLDIICPFGARPL
ncbi:hypothetical protein DM01DRAFT_1339790 [Hesseltinella vesiculosa]|uniref:Wax synthase domain-containing protein n=1 Tax=Hesseltinella vesiculosa TaxID=101127 RepID=A0A1X2G5S9_9FUNG|nr:hypothetical protein DM01DRAFT_1339790 [Hesseltinella vesiculosa]